MKLFRHHTPEFQREIEENNSFVLDLNRKFNHTGRNKNEAHIYFYCLTIQGAESYSNSRTKLFFYEAGDIKLLDLRNEESRAMLKDVIADILEEQRIIQNSIISDMKRAILRERRKRDIKRLEKIIKETQETIITEENIIKDNKRISGFTYWGQDVSDYQRGLLLKSEVIRLGYDGFIFEEYNNVPEVGIFKPAKPLN